MVRQFYALYLPPAVGDRLMFFAQYFLIYCLVGLCCQSGAYGGPPWRLGVSLLGREVTQAPAGGCRANNVR